MGIPLHFIELTHKSPEFDAAYDVLSGDISPEFLEEREFLRNRLRMRDEGPKSDRERILVQDGYTLHLLAAVRDNRVVGAIYGHLISKIGRDNKGICFVTYLSVLAEYRRQGIGTRLIEQLRKLVNADALRITEKPLVGMVFEIEERGKEEIKATVGKLGARPLDIVYCQPALRLGFEPEQMNLWLQPIPRIPAEMAADFTLSADAVNDMVRNMLTMEYVGPEMKGFDLASQPYTEFINSMGNRKEIGFLP